MTVPAARTTDSASSALVRPSASCSPISLSERVSTALHYLLLIEGGQRLHRQPRVLEAALHDQLDAVRAGHARIGQDHIGAVPSDHGERLGQAHRQLDGALVQLCQGLLVAVSDEALLAPVIVVLVATVAFAIPHLASRGGQQSSLAHLLYLLIPSGFALSAGFLAIVMHSAWTTVGIRAGFHLATVAVGMLGLMADGPAMWIAPGLLHAAPAGLA